MTNPNSRVYMGKTYYTYEGKKKTLGGISKMFNDLVLIEDEWVDAIRAQFKDGGYQHFLMFVKKIVRHTLSVDLTDAQAWLLIHDITNDGVPLALRDTENDEDANAATILKGAVSAVANTVMMPVEAGVGAVNKTIGKMTSKGEDLPEDTPLEE